MPFEAQNWITDLGVDPVFLQTNPFTPKKLLDYLAAVAKLQQRFFHPDRWEHEGLSARDSAQIRALFDRAKELNQETLPEAEAVTAQEHLNTAIGPNAKLQRALEFAQLKVEEASHEHQLNTRLEHNYVDMLKRTAATTKSLVDFGERKKLAIFNRSDTRNKIYELELGARKLKLRSLQLVHFNDRDEYLAAIAKKHWGLSNPNHHPGAQGYKALKLTNKDSAEIQVLGLVPKNLIYHFHRANARPDFERLAGSGAQAVNVNLLPEEIWQDVFSQLKFDFEPTAAKEQVLIGFRLDEAGEIKLYSLGQIHDSI